MQCSVDGRWQMYAPVLVVTITLAEKHRLEAERQRHAVNQAVGEAVDVKANPRRLIDKRELRVLADRRQRHQRPHRRHRTRPRFVRR
jgi:hypothetical protein